MKILVAYYTKTGSTEKVALALKKGLEKTHNVTLSRITPFQNLKAYQYKKDGRNLKLEEAEKDLSAYDLIFLGTPVWNFSPTPIVLSYIRGLKKAKGKKFALFSTCTALPGTTMQKMGSILSTQGVKVVGTLTVRSVFEISGQKLSEAEKFAEETVKKAK
jgi:flavodoxin